MSGIQKTINIFFRNTKDEKLKETVFNIQDNKFPKMSGTHQKYFVLLTSIIHINPNTTVKEAMTEMIKRDYAEQGDLLLEVDPNWNYLSNKANTPDHPAYKEIPNHATISRWIEMIKKSVKPNEREAIMTIADQYVEFHIKGDKAKLDYVVGISHRDFKHIHSLMTADEEMRGYSY